MSDSCDPMHCSPPGSSVHGILQARILEGVAIPFSRGSLQPRDRTWVSCVADRFFTVRVTREAPFNHLPRLKNITYPGSHLYKHASCIFTGRPEGKNGLPWWRGTKQPGWQRGEQSRSLGWEDPSEKETAAHFSILAQKIPRTAERGGLQSMRRRRVRHYWETKATADLT